MEKKHLNHAEAFADFLENVVPTLPRPIPNTLISAKQRFLGKVAPAKTGHSPRTLGAKLIRTLLEKHAPDRYKFHDFVTIEGDVEGK